MDGHDIQTTGIRTDLLGDAYAEVGADRAVLQNAELLEVVLGEDVVARQGSMVAFPGAVVFDHDGAGIGRFFEKAVTGEGLVIVQPSEGRKVPAHSHP